MVSDHVNLHISTQHFMLSQDLIKLVTDSCPFCRTLQRWGQFACKFISHHPLSHGKRSFPLSASCSTAKCSILLYMLMSIYWAASCFGLYCGLDRSSRHHILASVQYCTSGRPSTAANCMLVHRHWPVDSSRYVILSWCNLAACFVLDKCDRISDSIEVVIHHHQT